VASIYVKDLAGAALASGSVAAEDNMQLAQDALVL